VYAWEHYDAWASELGRKLTCPGAFGENFTIRGCLESDIHIGDVFVVGDAVVQCSQPRQPCSKLARFWGIKDFVVRVNKEGRSGWYFRVLKEGLVHPGDVLSLTERKWRDYSVAYANKVMLAGKKGDWNEISELAACPELSLSWKKQLETYLFSQGRTGSSV